MDRDHLCIGREYVADLVSHCDRGRHDHVSLTGRTRSHTPVKAKPAGRQRLGVGPWHDIVNSDHERRSSLGRDQQSGRMDHVSVAGSRTQTMLPHPRDDLAAHGKPAKT